MEEVVDVVAVSVHDGGRGIRLVWADVILVVLTSAVSERCSKVESCECLENLVDFIVVSVDSRGSVVVQVKLADVVTLDNCGCKHTSGSRKCLSGLEKYGVKVAVSVDGRRRQIPHGKVDESVLRILISETSTRRSQFGKLEFLIELRHAVGKVAVREVAVSVDGQGQSGLVEIADRILILVLNFTTGIRRSQVVRLIFLNELGHADGEVAVREVAVGEVAVSVDSGRRQILLVLLVGIGKRVLILVLISVTGARCSRASLGFLGELGHAVVLLIVDRLGRAIAVLLRLLLLLIFETCLRDARVGRVHLGGKLIWVAG
jgi:hypothetical protein